jgi:hypothetical protein
VAVAVLDGAVTAGGPAALVDGNRSEVVTATILLDTTPPTARVVRSRVRVPAGAEVVVDAGGSVDGAGGPADSGVDPAGFEWRFDDGATAAGPRAAHRFATPGAHGGSVTVRDRAGNVAVRRFAVTVTAAAGRRLVLPAAGARLQAGQPLALRWRADRRARFYNVQLLQGRRKPLSVFPTGPRLVVPGAILRPGPYRLLVWSGLTDKSVRPSRYAPRPWVDVRITVRAAPR